MQPIRVYKYRTSLDRDLKITARTGRKMLKRWEIIKVEYYNSKADNEKTKFNKGYVYIKDLLQIVTDRSTKKSITLKEKTQLETQDTKDYT